MNFTMGVSELIALVTVFGSILVFVYKEIKDIKKEIRSSDDSIRKEIDELKDKDSNKRQHIYDRISTIERTFVSKEDLDRYDRLKK